MITAWDWLLAQRMQSQQCWSTWKASNRNFHTRWRTHRHVPVIFRAYLSTKPVSAKTALSACQKPVVLECRICPSTLSRSITLYLSYICFRFIAKFNLELAVFVIDQLLIKPSALHVSLNGRRAGLFISTDVSTLIMQDACWCSREGAWLRITHHFKLIHLLKIIANSRESFIFWGK